MGSADTVYGGDNNAYMGAGTALVSVVGADAVGASRVTVVTAVVIVRARAVMRRTVTGPTVTATSSPRDDSWGNIVGGAS